MRTVDLNCDLGESFGHFQVGHDEEILKYITSANIACGYHAGDHNVMMKTVNLAKDLNIQIGAHPGLPDLGGFGRREMNISPDEVYNLVVYQIGAMQAVAKVNQVELGHVKPHGALYNMAEKNKELAKAIAKAVKDVDQNLVLFGLSGGLLCEAGSEEGLKTAHEVFADRTYQPDGKLTPRSKENALIHDPEEAVHQVLQMVKEQRVTAVNGEIIPIQADTICVHGDGPNALTFVQHLCKTLKNEGIIIQSVRMK
ncbi:LamB/YcsF family protein [Bacillus alveayuensis]|jgi:5-oxoprolinase (ATP-hydrolysing) subunit A|uniref:LamB/YcsF family protein n=1 Tax=Aeribacillus alveayuensis TaxID=279215 RepID=UPI0005D0F6EA|nr:5-oxoprolinase subunit PxpA [Bacillus alveayuensis]